MYLGVGCCKTPFSVIVGEEHLGDERKRPVVCSDYSMLANQVCRSHVLQRQPGICVLPLHGYPAPPVFGLHHRSPFKPEK